ncbi:MAG TPA: hypothetical protein VKA67_05880 [Verrucomicrobiae bacterium]|nr:hypothetical protein [Verrucomicrobiae bacterium]
MVPFERQFALESTSYRFAAIISSPFVIEVIRLPADADFSNSSAELTMAYWRGACILSNVNR